MKVSKLIDLPPDSIGDDDADDDDAEDNVDDGFAATDEK